jgi:predicted pyridoxine 5'-phosphate oxidase superfamily flavin-nucleotide-binding protein
MTSMYHPASRELQDRFDTRRLADRIEERLVRSEVDESSRTFVESRDMFFLATADEKGQPSCSYKGGAPGFVRVLGPKLLVFPSYDGNGMYLSMGNLGQNPQVGLLFIDFERGSRLRVSGRATLLYDDPLMDEYPEAQFIVRVEVQEVFPNCPRYIHKMARVEASPHVPTAGSDTPVPSWKRSEWAADALPSGDPGRDPSRPTR